MIGSNRALMRRLLEQFPEKWMPVFRKRMRSNREPHRGSRQTGQRTLGLYERPQLGKRFLEVAQMRHENLEIAFGPQHAPPNQRHQVVGAGRRPSAPELLPFRLRG